MSTRSSIKTICLTVALAAGLSLPGGAVLAGRPLPNTENLHANGSKADVRSGRGVFGHPEDFEVGSSAQRRSRGNVWKAPAGSNVGTTMGGNPQGIKAGRRERRAK